MALAQELQPASYKGFRFLTRSIRTEGGQKTTVHEFPGSNRRNVQDLGRLPDSFVVSAIVTGDNYIADVARLTGILSEGGFGDFIHPSRGTFNVKVSTYTLVEEDADQGRARFEINFLTSSTQVQPIAQSSNVGAVSRRTESVKSALSDRIKTEYKVNSGFRGNFTDATTQINEISDEFLVNAQQFIPAPIGLATFERSVEAFRDNATVLIQNPTSLAASLFGLFDTFDAIQVTATTSFFQLLSFFDFGDDDIPNRNDTAGLIQRTNNRNILRQSVQVGALAEAYREASLIDFQTVPEINDANTRLDTQYQKVKNQVNEPTKQELSLLRDDIRKLFDDQRLTTSEVIELDLPVLPAIVQAQSLYGADAQAQVDQLIEVNSTRDTGTLGGRATKVLTE